MARQTSGAAAHLEYGLFAAGCGALRSLPLPSAARLGICLGAITAALDRFNRPVAMRNLEIAFPQWPMARRLATLKAMYRNWGMMAAEWCHMHELTRANIAKVAHYEGLDNWERALALSPGGGGLIFTAHFGNFELLIAAHALYGNPVAIVHRPLRNPFIDATVAAMRTRVGNRMIKRKGAAREVTAILRRHGVVAVPIDLDVRRGVFVDFFSLKACTTDGLARIAMASGLPVVPGFIVREGRTLHHRIVILPALDIVHDGNRDEAIVENTQRATRAVEDMIRQYPDHWNWIHRRWKTRPPGEARFY